MLPLLGFFLDSANASNTDTENAGQCCV